MNDYISRDKINEAFDSIWDCADMVFEPDDHCCAADDCGHCKWLQTKNAIKKKIDHIPAADVRPVVRGKWIRRSDDSCVATCPVCGNENNYAFCIMSFDEPSLVQQDMFCPFCGADMREVTSGDTRTQG